MKLKYIELYGFKSFAEKTRLEFNEDIVAVVGPNGSGKSNISDAVRWVLGEQSAKSLRGTKMEDVIFSGTQEKNQMNMAHVTIAFDNRDGAIDLPYDEVTITRKVYRSGESEYKINKNNVRLKDIKELFLDTGIGKDGYSIIGQGRIEDVLSSKSEDRRYLFEEASGISKFKYQKIESTKRLEKTEENLKQVQQDLKIKTQQAEILLKQAQNAKRGYKLTQELEQQELSLLQQSLEKLDQQKIRFDADAAKIDVDLKELRDEQQEIAAKLAPHREALEGIGQSRQEAEEDAQKIEARINYREKEKSVLEEALRFQEKDAERLRAEIEVRKDRFEKTQETLVENRSSLEKLEKEREEIAEELAKYENASTFSLEETEKALREARTSLSSLMERLNHLQFESEQKENAHTALETQKEATRITFQQVERELKQSRSSIEKQLAALKNLQEEESAHKATLETLAKAIEAQVESQEKAQSVRQDAAQDLIRLQSEYRVLSTVHQNYEGYYRPVQQLMRRAKNDASLSERIVGVLADMIEVVSPYETAVDVSLGQALQNIVVENEQDAKFLIDYMKRNQLGRITFLPISRIHGQRPVYSSEPEELVNGTEAIRFDRRIEGIVNHLLSRTTFVENIDDAVSLSKKKGNTNRIVSLEGDVVNHWGSMVGGSLQKRNTGSLLNRKSDLNRLTASCKEAEKALNAAEKHVEDVLADGVAIKEKRKNVERSLEQNRESQNNLRFQRSKVTMELEVLEERKATLQAILDEQSGYDKDVFVKQLATLDTEKVALEKRIETLEGELQLATQESVDRDKERMRLEAKRDWNERERSLKENDIAAQLELMEDLETQNAQGKTSLETLESEIKEAKARIQTYGSELEESHANIETLRTRIQRYKEKQEVMGQEILSQDTRERELKQSILELEKQEYAVQVRRENYEQQRQQLFDSYLSSYDLEMEGLEDRLSRLIPVEASKQKVTAIKQELTQIGYFNFESIEEYETLQAEVDFLQSQVEDLFASKADIEALIKDLDKTMKEMFAENFANINTKFNDIFRILFDGGRAELILDGDDILSAGIEIVAQPPGKKLKSLGLLSGGERSLTAVSLLFAIFSIRPAPFCILDEIDASLDEANIGRYVKYLMSMTESSQFILISHRKTTMEMADVLYGVTMAEEGVSRVVMVNLKDIVEV